MMSNNLHCQCEFFANIQNKINLSLKNKYLGETDVSTCFCPDIIGIFRAGVVCKI
jgi:hypothetical protein